MGEIYKVKYHYLVERDLKRISPPLQKIIFLTTKEKLSTNPALFGKPLRHLRNYRKLRVSDYRIIFKIQKETVYILLIAHRSVIYKEIYKRMR